MNKIKIFLLLSATAILITAITIFLSINYGLTRFTFGSIAVSVLFILYGLSFIIIKFNKKYYEYYREILMSSLYSDRRQEMNLETLKKDTNIDWSDTVYQISNKIIALENNNKVNTQKIHDIQKNNKALVSKIFDNIAVIREEVLIFRPMINKLEKTFIELISVIVSDETGQKHMEGSLNFFAKQNSILIDLSEKTTNSQDTILQNVTEMHNKISDLESAMESITNTFNANLKIIGDSIDYATQLNILFKNLMVELNQKNESTDASTQSVVAAISDIINGQQKVEYHDKLGHITDYSKTLKLLEGFTTNTKNAINRAIDESEEMNSILFSHKKIFVEDILPNYVNNKNSKTKKILMLLSEYIVDYRERLDNAVDLINKLDSTFTK